MGVIIQIASYFSFGILLVNKNFFNAHVKISGNFERQLNNKFRKSSKGMESILDMRKSFDIMKAWKASFP